MLPYFLRHPKWRNVFRFTKLHSTSDQGGALGPDSKRQRVTADAETARKELLGKFEPTDTFEATDSREESNSDNLWDLWGFAGVVN